MNLIDQLVQIIDDPNIAIWAEGFYTSSKSRWGSRRFRNGGELDNWRYVGSGEEINRFLRAYCDDVVFESEDGMRVCLFVAAEEFLICLSNGDL